MAEEHELRFGAVLRRLRRDRMLTQEELAAAAGLSVRSVSDLERGVNLTARKETARLLADALGLAGEARVIFVAASQARRAAADVLGGSASASSRTLPGDVAYFTGREAEIRGLVDARSTAGTRPIYAIGGMPGVGKTALAVHVSHMVREFFPDRQLFIDLHAHSPARGPVSPQAALASLLSAVGVDAGRLPEGLDDRAALWRDQLAGRRALLLLDNAADSEQVIPLLPGSDNCMVLVTSRRHLGDLPGAVTPLLLDVLPADQACEMFVRLVPRAHSAAPEDLRELMRLAGHLPLAISLLARVYARHHTWTLDDLLNETRGSILTLAAEQDSVAAAFSVSYKHLPADRQRFFRLLGLHPGATIDAYASAALADVPVIEAAAHLDALHIEGILAEVGYRRYGMHDLIRGYARHRAFADAADDCDDSLERLLDYYQETAATAEAVMTRESRIARPLVRPCRDAPDLRDRAQAFSWARTERENLLACLDHVTHRGQHARVMGLTAGLAALLRLDGPWSDAIVRNVRAAQSARRIGVKADLANALINLGVVQTLSGQYTMAAESLNEALDIYRSLGDHIGQANTFRNIAIARRLTGNNADAILSLQSALAIFTDIGDQLGAANTLGTLGSTLRQAADYPAAASALRKAIGIYRDLGDQRESTVLIELGCVLRLSGDCPGSIEVLKAGLSLSEEIGDKVGQGNALRNIGVVRKLTGDYAGAYEALHRALSVCRDMGELLGQANVLNDLGDLHRRSNDYSGAAQALGEALDIFREIGNQVGQANVLANLGAVLRLTGQYSHAAEALDEALRIFGDVGDQGGQAETLNEVGNLRFAEANPTSASVYHQRAMHLARQIGSSWDEAHALAGLARCAQAAGRLEEARSGLHRARNIFRAIGAAEAMSTDSEITELFRRYHTVNNP